jgi:hypothetical protein
VSRAAESHRRLVEEIAREKAVARSRSHCSASRTARDAAARQRLAAEYERAWRAAEAARLTLVIQREAVGLRHHRDVDQRFPRPPRKPS